ncbi:hypothetical protein YC2023_014115 [Brassica napus]
MNLTNTPFSVQTAHTPQTSKLEPEASRSALLRMQMVRRFRQTSPLERVLQNTRSKNDARSPIQRQPLHRRQLARALGKLLIYCSGCTQGAAGFSAAQFESLMGNLIEKKQDNGLAKENVFEKETFFVGGK